MNVLKWIFSYVNKILTAFSYLKFFVNGKKVMNVILVSMAPKDYFCVCVTLNTNKVCVWVSVPKKATKKNTLILKHSNKFITIK